MHTTPSRPPHAHRNTGGSGGGGRARHSADGVGADHRVATISHAELVDLRAFQRTFDGAYARTALGQLAQAVLILRLFQRAFYYVGLAYTVSAFVLIFVSVYRYRLSVVNHAHAFRGEPRRGGVDDGGDDRVGNVDGGGERAGGAATSSSAYRGRGALKKDGTPSEEPARGSNLTKGRAGGAASRAPTSSTTNANAPSATATATGATGAKDATTTPKTTTTPETRTTSVLRPTFRTAGDVVLLATTLLLAVDAWIFVVLLRV